MNKLLIPPSPNGYRIAGMCYTPDDQLIYGSICTIIILNEKIDSMRIIPKAHPQRIVALCVNPNWNKPHKFLASLCEENVLKIWDIDTLSLKYQWASGSKLSLVGIQFCSDLRIVCAADSGDIVIWNFTIEEVPSTFQLFTASAVVTCMSICPHCSWLMALGLNDGQVIIVDLKKRKLLRKIRGDRAGVVAMAWCPAPINIFPQKVQNRVRNRTDPALLKQEDDVVVASTSTEIVNQKVNQKVNPWLNLIHADDDEVPPDYADIGRKMPEPFDNDFDYLSECKDLKDAILGTAVKITEKVDEKFNRIEPTSDVLVASIERLLKTENAPTILEFTNEGKSAVILPQSEEKVDKDIIDSTSDDKIISTVSLNDEQLESTEALAIPVDKNERPTPPVEAPLSVSEIIVSHVEEHDIADDVSTFEPTSEDKNSTSKVTFNDEESYEIPLTATNIDLPESQKLHEENKPEDSSRKKLEQDNLQKGDAEVVELNSNTEDLKEDANSMEEFLLKVEESLPKEEQSPHEEVSLPKVEESFLKEEQSSTQDEQSPLKEEVSLLKIEESIPQIEESLPKKEQSLPNNEVTLSKVEESFLKEEQFLPKDEQSPLKEEVSLPKIEASIPEIEVSLPKEEQSFSNEEVSLPKVEESFLKEEQFLPKDEQSPLKEEVSLPKIEESIPQIEESLSKKEQSLPNEEVSLPKVQESFLKEEQFLLKDEQSPLKEEVSLPKIEESIPKIEVSLPEEEQSLPTEEVTFAKVETSLPKEGEIESGETISKDAFSLNPSEPDCYNPDNPTEHASLPDHAGSISAIVPDNDEHHCDLAKEPDENAQEFVVEEEDPRTEYLLATSTKDGKIHIWRAGTDFRLQCFLYLPENHYSRSSTRAHKKGELWISLCWIAPKMLLSSSKCGELLQWNLPKPNDSKKQFRVLHSLNKTALLFNIVAKIKILTPFNWCDEQDLRAWTFGYRSVLADVRFSEDNVNVTSHSTTNLINCLTALPIDPTKVALGLRDGTLHVLDLSVPNFSFLFVHRRYNNISALAYHPLMEDVLGFATESGMIGFTKRKSKTGCTLFSHTFDLPVHKIEWGPLLGDKNNLGMYVVCGGQVHIYDITQYKQAPLALVMEEKTPCHVFKTSWKPDYSILLVMAKSGSVLVYSTCLKLLTKLYLSDVTIRNIVWHPSASNNDCEKSPYCNTFAAYTTSSCFTYDLKGDEILSSGTVIRKSILLDNSKYEIRSISWNYFNDKIIACYTMDGVIYVLNAATKVILSSINVPGNVNMTEIMWSPINELDIVVVGFCVMILQCPPIDTDCVGETSSSIISHVTGSRKVKNKRSGKRRYGIKPSTSSVVEKTLSTGIIKKITPKNAIAPVPSTSDNPDVIVKNLRKLLNTISDAGRINGQVDDDSSNDDENDYDDSHKIFGSQKDVVHLLSDNQNNHKSSGLYSCSDMISLWEGDIDVTIKEAINDKRITPELLSIAPMVSINVWKQCCEIYAEQLAKDDEDCDPILSAFYYISCHKISEAVTVLCNHHKYREALALVKCRSFDDQTLIKSITEKWAQHYVNDGAFELAAECYISIREYELAAMLLFKRKHLVVLEVAAELAEKSGNKDLYNAIISKCEEIQTNLTDNNIKAENRASGDEQHCDLPSKADVLLKIID